MKNNKNPNCPGKDTKETTFHDNERSSHQKDNNHPNCVCTKNRAK